MEPTSKLHNLIALAEETSSDRRRELLRGVTDLFFNNDEQASPEAMPLFDDVLSQLAGEMESLFGPSWRTAWPLSKLRLIAPFVGWPQTNFGGGGVDPFNSPALTETDLIDVAKMAGQEHLQAISRRTEVSSLFRRHCRPRRRYDPGYWSNPGAQMSRNAQEIVVDRAIANPALHSAVVNRNTLPPDLLNEMYFVVEANLRAKIAELNSAMDPATVDVLWPGARSWRPAMGPCRQTMRAPKRRRRCWLAAETSTLAGFLRNRKPPNSFWPLEDPASSVAAADPRKRANSTPCRSSARRQVLTAPYSGPSRS
jgi:hypothetical protein